MKEKNRKLLLVCLEVISLGIAIPIVYLGTFKLLLDSIEDTFYAHDIYEQRWIATWMVFLLVLGLDVSWIILMRLCPREKMHVEVVLTLLVFTLSASVLSCFVILDALERAFS